MSVKNRFYECEIPLKAAEFDAESNSMVVVDLPGDKKERVRCSVCGKIKLRSEFCDANGLMVRTNCKDCYELPAKEFCELGKRFEECLNDDLKKFGPTDFVVSKYNQIASAPTVRDLIAELQKLDPEARIKNGNDFGIFFEEGKLKVLGRTFKFIDFGYDD